MSRRYLPTAALLTTVFIWGTTFVATKLALEALPPLSLTVVRFALGLVVLLPFALVEQRHAQMPLPWPQLMLAGLFGGSLYFALQNLGLVYTTASEASLILAGIPAITALLSAVFLREQSGLFRIAGIVLSIIGVAVIIVADRNSRLGGGTIWGDLLIAVSGLAWASYTVLAKSLEARVTPAVISTASVGFGALFLLPFAGFETVTQTEPAANLTGWLAIAYLGFVASVVPFLLWNYALGKVDASEAAVYTNLLPLVTVVSAMIVLHEILLPLQLLGGLLVLLGVWAASHQRLRKGAV